MYPSAKKFGFNKNEWLSMIMSADGGDCEAVLDGFSEASIDVEGLAAQLQEQGAKGFVASWKELMAVIASKGAALTKDR
jgi:transaldolase